MRKIILIFSLSLLGLMSVYAQNVGINSTGAAPDASAGLDVNFTNKGMLIPRVDIADLSTEAPITSAATSSLVYNTNTTTGPGYFFWDGSDWIKLFDGNDGKPWRLLGNAGTTAGTNFLGTTDNVSLSFKTNNTERMRILNSGNVGIGTTSPGAKLDVAGTSEFNGTMNLTNHTITRINKLEINDPGDHEGIIWSGTNAQIFVSPLNSGNSDGYLRLINDGGIVFEAGAEDTESMIITSSNNVGIGTNSPSYKLTVIDGSLDRVGNFESTEASADNYAVYGACKQTDYYGFGGYFEGGYMGVRARVDATGSNYYYGVYSTVTGGGHQSYGVIGEVNVTGGKGIIGYNNTTSTTSDYTTAAVYGESTYDVNGVTSGTVYNATVQGWCNPPNNHDAIGVWGQCWPSDYWGYGGWFEGGYYGVKAVGQSGNYAKGLDSDVYSGGMLAKGMVGVNSIGSKIGLVTVSKELGLLSIGDKSTNSPAAYFDGSVVRKGYEAMLIDNGEDNIPAYTMVSNKVNIQAIGQATLTNGIANVNFDNSFASTVSNSEPIIVIITPTSQNTGSIIVTNTTVNGFEVVSDNNSNGTFNWIAIGRIKGYESTDIKQEYKNSNFIDNKIDVLYPHSKGYPQFNSNEFYSTSKSISTHKKEKIKGEKKLKPKINNNTK